MSTCRLHHSSRRAAPAVSIGLLAAAAAVAVLQRPAPPARAAEPPGASPAEAGPLRRVTVAEARRQAELLHTAMHATLHAVHHRYYREDAGLPIPAAVVDEIFGEIAREEQVQLRWLAVQGQAMNTDHTPRDQFERDAFTALDKGQKVHEAVIDGLYRRAGAITLTNHCLKCHVPDRKSTENRTAGLIVAIPVTEE